MIRAAMLSTVAMSPLLQAVEEADPRQIDWVSAYLAVRETGEQNIEEKEVASPR